MLLYRMSSYSIFYHSQTKVSFIIGWTVFKFESFLLMMPISCSSFKSLATVGSKMFNVCAISFLVIEGAFSIRPIISLWRFFIVSFVVSFIVSLIDYFDKRVGRKIKYFLLDNSLSLSHHVTCRSALRGSIHFQSMSL